MQRVDAEYFHMTTKVIQLIKLRIDEKELKLKRKRRAERDQLEKVEEPCMYERLRGDCVCIGLVLLLVLLV